MDIKSKNKPSVEFSMASMTDIVFLLLIFFMLTSTLVSPNAMKLLLPKSSSKTLAKQSVSVSIDKDINFFVNETPIAIDQLEGILRAQIASDTTATIVLNTDKSVPIEHVVRVMDIANQMRIKMILATAPLDK